MQSLTTRVRVFVDSSAYFASAVVNDVNNSAAQAALADFARQRTQFFTTRYVLAETHALLVARRRSASVALTILQRIESSDATAVVPTRDQDEDRARIILAQYRDHLFSLTDALSFAVMERLKIQYAFTFDSDFSEYGLLVLPGRP